MSTSKVEKPPYHHGSLREALVEAGLAILAEGGDPSSLSLREAARRAGVSAMAPYRHFPDKEALLGALAAVGFARLSAALERADRADDPKDALVAQGLAYVGFACTEPALFRLMFSARVAGAADCKAAGERAFTIMARRVAGLAPSVGPETASLYCWALVHGLAGLAVDGQLDDRGSSPATIADAVLRLFPPVA